VELFEVIADGIARDAQLEGDRVVGQTSPGEVEDVAFARG
jgi:hypothetical protein